MQKSVGNLTLVEKIGQMVLVGLDGTEAEGDIIELIQTYRIGGIYLKRKNLENVEQIQNLINSLKAANLGNSVPLFIAMGQEVGRGNILPKDIRKLPSIKYIIDKSDKNTIYDVHSVMANILKGLGVNMNFAPLLDMGGTVEGTSLGDRVISTTNPNLISIFGTQIIEAYKNSGIIAVPKHFPGHASTKSDRGNLTIPYTKKSLAKMEQSDLIPFKNAIDYGVETLLVGNIHMARLNMFTPATMSARVLSKLLKGRLGYEGLVIADDICSTCIKVQYGPKDAAKKAIMAGSDIVIIGEASKAKDILEHLEKQVVRGNLDEKAIELRVQKILDLKLKYALNDEEVEKIDIDAENNKIEKILEIIN